MYGNTGPLANEASTTYSLDTPYAITKLLGEQYVNFFNQHHNIPTVVLRFFNSYGPGEYPGKYRNVIPNFMRLVLNGQPLTITGTGEETRDFTYVDDTIQAVRLAISHPDAVGRTFNVGTGRETTVRELAEAIIRVCKKTVPINYIPRRDWDSVDRRSADISLMKGKLGYRQSIELDDGLARTYKWFIENGIAGLESR